MGTAGIVIVLAAVACSLGIFGYIGLATTMLTIEVIPFLVLAIGVDNIFIFVHAYDRIPNKSYENIEKNLGKALGEVGPSIILCTTTEIFCFAIGSLSEMPAVNTFAMYAAVAVLFDFVFQITAFVALMCLDQKRYQVGIVSNRSRGLGEIFIVVLQFPEEPIGLVLLFQAEPGQRGH